MEEVLRIVPKGFVVEVAQYLISSRVKMPDSLTEHLVQCKQVSHVVSCLLSDQKQDVVQAMAFVTNND